MMLLLSAVLALPAHADLMSAAKSGDAKTIRTLLAAGAAPDARDEHGVTPLYAAAFRGHEDAALALVEGGADPEAAVGDRITPLMTAAMTGLPALLEALLKKGALADRRDDVGQNALNYAINHNRATPAQIESLIRAGAKLDAPGLPAGMTVVHYAALQCRTDVLTRLLAAGASPNARDKRGSTPPIQAGLGRCAEAKSLLLAAGAKPSLKDNERKTAADYERLSLKRP